MNDVSVEDAWLFWRPIVCNPDGSLNAEAVKKELHDFYVVMGIVPKVYDHVTGGRISKIMTDPDAVISEADAHYSWIHEE